MQLIANESTLNTNSTNISIPEIEICVSKLQDVNDPITIIKITNDDYSIGANSINLTIPYGLTFDTQSGSVYYLTGADITGQPTLGFINSTTAAIDFNTGGIGSQDEIRVEGLRIKAISSATNGNMIAVTNNNVEFEVIAANLVVSNKPEALFTLDPDATTINAQTSPNIFLEQVTPIDPFLIVKPMYSLVQELQMILYLYNKYHWVETPFT